MSVRFIVPAIFAARRRGPLRGNVVFLPACVSSWDFETSLKISSKLSALTFTHDYGAAIGPVDKITGEGLPELFVKNIPPETTAPELRIDRPKIYYGEMSNDRVYVNTRQCFARSFNARAGSFS